MQYLRVLDPDNPTDHRNFRLNFPSTTETTEQESIYTEDTIPSNDLVIQIKWSRKAGEGKDRNQNAYNQNAYTYLCMYYMYVCMHVCMH